MGTEEVKDTWKNTKAKGEKLYQKLQKRDSMESNFYSLPI